MDRMYRISDSEFEILERATVEGDEFYLVKKNGGTYLMQHYINGKLSTQSTVEAGNDDDARESFAESLHDGEQVNDSRRIKDDDSAYDVADTFTDIYEQIYEHDDLDFVTDEDLGMDRPYHTLLKSVDDAERFNYHSDYWGDADWYQKAAVEFLDNVEPYIGERIKIDFGDEVVTALFDGVLIDRKYNSHIKIHISDVRPVGETND